MVTIYFTDNPSFISHYSTSKILLTIDGPKIFPNGSVKGEDML